MSEEALFNFDWPVDQGGYEIDWLLPDKGRSTLLGQKVTEDIIRPRGGAIRYYRPLEDQPGLARRLAGLAETPTQDAYLDFAKNFGLLRLSIESSNYERIEDWHRVVFGLDAVFSRIDAGDTQAAAELFNENIISRFTAKIHYEHARRPALNIVPGTLQSALWFQVAGEITDGTKFKKCAQCPTWLPVGKGAKYRTSRKFCSTKCRKAYNYAKRKEQRK